MRRVVAACVVESECDDVVVAEMGLFVATTTNSLAAEMARWREQRQLQHFLDEEHNLQPPMSSQPQHLATFKMVLENKSHSHVQPMMAMAPKLMTASSPVMAHWRELMALGACVMKVGSATSY